MRKYTKHLLEGVAYTRYSIILNFLSSQKIKVIATMIIVLE